MASKVSDSTTRGFARVGGIAAFGFIGFLLGSNIVLQVAGMPAPGASIADAARFITDHAGVAEFAWACATPAFVCVIVFGASAHAVLRNGEHADGTAWSLVGLAGLILQTATFAVVTALRFTLTAITDRSSPVAAAVWTLHNALFIGNGVFLAIAMLGLSIGGRRGGLLRAWHANLGFVSAAILFVWSMLTPLQLDHTGPLGLVDLIGWLMWVVWVGAYGVALIRLRANRIAVPA